MLKHIAIAALRNMAANRLISAIAILGLSVGIAAALLMALVIRNQISFEHFIPGYERTYIATSSMAVPGHEAMHNVLTNNETAPLLRLNAPEVESATRLIATAAGPDDPAGKPLTVKSGAVTAKENIYWAEPNLASVLPLPVFRGDLGTALARPDGIVLTRTMARKYFGRDDAMGGQLLLDGHPMTVRAVLEDFPQGGTNLQYGIFASSRASYSTFARTRPVPGAFGIGTYTYLRLKPAASLAALEHRLPALAARVTGGLKMVGQPIPYSMLLDRIDRLNLDEDLHRGALARLMVEGLVGLLVLFIATANFINLLTARAARRAGEVGLRKACGAGRSHLMTQFLGEAILTVAFATCLAMTLAEWLLPKVNAFLTTGAAFSYWHDPGLLLALLLGVGMLGLAAGAWPAFLLSALRPIGTLRGSAGHADGSGPIRKALTGLQFAILIILLVATVVVWQQRRYATSEGMRVDTSQMLMVRGSCLPAFRAEVRKLPGVEGASCSDTSLLDNSSATLVLAKGVPTFMDTVRIDWGIFALYHIKALAGSLATTNPEGDFVPGGPNLVVINKLALARLGFASPQAAIGQKLGSAEGEHPQFIAAVVPDFAFSSVERATTPVVYAPAAVPDGIALVSIRLKGRQIPETLAAIDRLWIDTGNKGPINRFFLTEHMQELYAGMVRQGELLAGFAGIAILLACLGLFGVAVATAERRTKEIGIRKAMGASTGDVVALLLWQFAQPVLWANVIAWPVAWWLMRRWLSGFAYHVDLHWWVFAGASLGALAIALATVAGQAFLTARQKPVLALRYE
jgi:putative ABC transport system permease protein